MESDVHKHRMEALKRAKDARIREAQIEKGLLIVHTGHGKGKTTAALGMLTRALSHGLGCAVIQFVKSRPESAQSVLASPRLQWDQVGEGFTWNVQDRDRDIACARMGWELALDRMADPAVGFLLLDELNIVLGKGYLPLDEVLGALTARRSDLHIVVTGRGAPEPLIQAADLVTEMKAVKHPLKEGIKAQAGIDF